MIFDISLLIFVGAGFYQGFRNGIIYSLFSVAGWFLGIIAALKFSYLLTETLHGFAKLNPQTLVIISFILVVLLVLLLMKLIAWSLEQVLKSFSLNLPNQIAGGVLHALVGLYVFCMFVWFLNKLQVIPHDQTATSHVYKYISDLAPQVMEATGKVVPVLRDTFNNFDELFGHRS